MLVPCLLVAIAAPPTFGPGLYRGKVLIPTGTVTVDLRLKKPVAEGVIDIHEQGLRRYPITAVIANGNALRFSLPDLPGNPRFTLSYGKKGFKGIYSQGRQTFDTILRPVPGRQRADEAQRGLRARLRAALTADGSPGLAYAIVVGGYQTFGGFGVHGVRASAKITANTPFALGTISRTVTAVAVAHNVESDRTLDWATTLTSKLPAFRLARTDGGLAVTVGDLVDGQVPFARHAAVARVLARADEALLLKRLGGLPLATRRAEDEDWSYALMGRILAPPNQDGTANIQRLLDTFSIPMTFEPPSSRALGHRLDGRRVVGVEDEAGFAVADGLFGSARSVAMWAQFHLRRAALSSASWDRLQKNNAGGWRSEHRRGHRIRTVINQRAGTSIAVMLAPDDQVGVVVMGNRRGSQLPRLLAENLIDRLNGMPPAVDLVAAARAARRAEQTETKNQRRSKLPKRVRRTKPAHRLTDYAGRYAHPGYGDLQVEIRQNQLRARLEGATGRLDHWHYETFASEETTGLPRVPWTFITDAAGQVVAVEAVLDEQTAPLRFARGPR